MGELGGKFPTSLHCLVAGKDSQCHKESDKVAPISGRTDKGEGDDHHCKHGAKKEVVAEDALVEASGTAKRSRAAEKTRLG